LDRIGSRSRTISAEARGRETYAPVLALPGTSSSTSPGDYRINKQLQMMKFDGTRWVLFGPILTDDFVGN
jgi:hypothetical protein